MPCPGAPRRSAAPARAFINIQEQLSGDGLLPVSHDNHLLAPAGATHHRDDEGRWICIFMKSLSMEMFMLKSFHLSPYGRHFSLSFFSSHTPDFVLLNLLPVITQQASVLLPQLTEPVHFSRLQDKREQGWHCG